MTQQRVAARSRRSRAVTVSLAAALSSLGVVACSSGSDSRAACVDHANQQRVDDAQCRSPHTGFGWYYFPRGAVYPGIGSRVSGGTFTTPGGSVSRGGLDSRGGTVSRGGFGSSGGTSGSHSVGG